MLIFRQAKPLHELVDPVSQSLFRYAIDPGEKFERFSCGQAWIEGRGGGVEPEVATDLFGLRCHAVPHQCCGSSTRFEYCRQHSQGSGLSRSISPEQAENLPWAALEIDPIHGSNLAAILIIKGLAQSAHLDCGFH